METTKKQATAEKTTDLLKQLTKLHNRLDHQLEILHNYGLRCRYTQKEVDRVTERLMTALANDIRR